MKKLRFYQNMTFFKIEIFQFSWYFFVFTLMIVNDFGEKWAQLEPLLNLAHSKTLNFKSENDKILIKLDAIMKAIETHINIANENHNFLPE